MASKDRYVTGQGMFGGPGGTYGRFSVSSNVPSLLSAQFQTQKDIEEQQMRRYNRRHEPNYSGAGSWYWNYPNMTGAIGAGSMLPVRDNDVAQREGNDKTGQTASVDGGLGQGGTAASATGAAGGSPA